jgi:large subunit ribosomal protein L2
MPGAASRSAIKGGGHKKLYRDIDFLMTRSDIIATVKTVEYDPFRTGYIGLVFYKDGTKRYVLLPKTMKVGNSFMVSEKAPIETGNRLPLKKIPVGTFVFNIEIKPGSGAKLVRSAGSFAQVIANDANYTHIKMPSSEVRKIHETLGLRSAPFPMKRTAWSSSARPAAPVGWASDRPFAVPP